MSLSVRLTRAAKRIKELEAQLVEAQKEITQLREELDAAFEAGWQAAQESISEWLEALRDESSRRRVCNGDS